MWCGESVSPVAGVRHADALDPVDFRAAGGAVEDERAELPLQVGLHLQEFQPDLLRRDDDWVIRCQPGLVGLTK